jgi:hypothetical protein
VPAKKKGAGVHASQNSVFIVTKIRMAEQGVETAYIRVSTANTSQMLMLLSNPLHLTIIIGA